MHARFEDYHGLPEVAVLCSADHRPGPECHERDDSPGPAGALKDSIPKEYFNTTITTASVGDGNFANVQEFAAAIKMVKSSGDYTVYNSEGSGAYGRCLSSGMEDARTMWMLVAACAWQRTTIQPMRREPIIPGARRIRIRYPCI